MKGIVVFLTLIFVVVFGISCDSINWINGRELFLFNFQIIISDNKTNQKQKSSDLLFKSSETNKFVVTFMKSKTISILALTWSQHVNVKIQTLVQLVQRVLSVFGRMNANCANQNLGKSGMKTSL